MKYLNYALKEENQIRTYFKHLISLSKHMVLSLFEKLFKRIQKMFRKDPVIVKTTIENLPLLLEKSFVSKRMDLEDFSAKKLSEVKYLHSRAKAIIKNLNQTPLEEKVDKRLNHAVETSKRQLLIQLEKLLDKIDPSKIEHKTNSYREYAGKSEAILVLEINTFRKNIAYTSFYHKEEMKELGETLQNLLNNLHDMNQKFLIEKEVFEFEHFKNNIGASLKKKKELLDRQKQIENLKEKIVEKQMDLKAQEEKINQKMNNSEMQKAKKAEEELVALANSKQDLKLEISALLLNIDRPLSRYKQIVDSGRKKATKEEKEMLDLFITNPILALKKDPKAELFKKILTDMKNLIESGEIELKDKEKEKRLDALENILKFDFFGKVFWKMNELQLKQIELNKTISTSAAKSDLEKEINKQKDLEREINELNEKINSEEKQKQVIQRNISNEIDSVKNFAQKTLKQTIILEEETF